MVCDKTNLEHLFAVCLDVEGQCLPLVGNGCSLLLLVDIHQTFASVGREYICRNSVTAFWKLNFLIVAKHRGSPALTNPHCLCLSVRILCLASEEIGVIQVARLQGSEVVLIASVVIHFPSCRSVDGTVACHTAICHPAVCALKVTVV